MSLRSEVVEAMARVNHNRSPKCYEAFGDEEDGCRCVFKAEAALDAVLDVLEERREEWKQAAGAPVVRIEGVLQPSTVPIVSLIAALRESGGGE